MKHTLVKIIIISRVIEIIASEYKLTIDEARDIFYKSNTINLLDDEETGLYGDSPYYVFSLFEQERNKKESIIS